jgi:hypothetical protein
VELLEHWWHDSTHGGSRQSGFRQEVLIRHDPETGAYEVEHRAGLKSTTRRYESEAEARYIAEALRAGIVGWRNLVRRRDSGQ